jgi:hypothetical protein
MKTIALSREFDVSSDALRSVLADVELLFDTAGCDVRRDGVDLLVSNWIDTDRSELAIRIIRHAGGVLAYKQIDGPFETMQTRYMIDSKDDGTRLSIQTAYETTLDDREAFINEQEIERQRCREFEAVDALVDTVPDSTSSGTQRHIAGEGGDRA